MDSDLQFQLARDAALQYERVLVRRILGPMARALTDMIYATPATGTLLDVSCGTGAATRHLASRFDQAALIIGIDLDAGMIDVARNLPPRAGAPIEWRLGDVRAIELPDMSVDCVICAQTLQFVPERSTAVREMLRVLRPGGTLGLSAWSELPRNPYFNALKRAIAEHLGVEAAALIQAIFSLGDSEGLGGLLERGGFRQASLQAIDLQLELPLLRSFVAEHVRATALAGAFDAAGADRRSAIVAAVCAALDTSGNDAITLPFHSLAVLAIRPH